MFMVYLVLDKVFSSLWCNLYALGQIFIAENGQILKTQSGRLVTLLTSEDETRNEKVHSSIFALANTHTHKHLRTRKLYLDRTMYFISVGR